MWFQAMKGETNYFPLFFPAQRHPYYTPEFLEALKREVDRGSDPMGERHEDRAVDAVPRRERAARARAHSNSDIRPFEEIRMLFANLPAPSEESVAAVRAPTSTADCAPPARLPSSRSVWTTDCRYERHAS